MVTAKKTLRPKNIVIGSKVFVKCPYPDCAYMVEDKGFDAKTGLRISMLFDPKNSINEHIKGSA